MSAKTIAGVLDRFEIFMLLRTEGQPCLRSGRRSESYHEEGTGRRAAIASEIRLSPPGGRSKVGRPLALSWTIEVAQESWRLFPQEVVIEATVPRDAIFLDASAKGVPVALLHRRPPPVSSVFDQIAAEIETRIGLASEEDDDVVPLVD